MDLYNYNSINDLLLLGQFGENSDFDFDESDNWKRRLLSAKMLVDRWGEPISDIFIHECHKKAVLADLGSAVSFNIDNSITIWGAELHFKDYVPKEKGVALSFDGDALTGDIMSRAVSAFPVCDT